MKTLVLIIRLQKTKEYKFTVSKNSINYSFIKNLVLLIDLPKTVLIIGF